MFAPQGSLYFIKTNQTVLQGLVNRMVRKDKKTTKKTKIKNEQCRKHPGTNAERRFGILHPQHHIARRSISIGYHLPYEGSKIDGGGGYLVSAAHTSQKPRSALLHLEGVNRRTATQVLYTYSHWRTIYKRTTQHLDRTGGSGKQNHLKNFKQ